MSSADRPFVSGDWGTSRLRLRLLAGGDVRAEVESDEGIARVFAGWQAAGGDRERYFLRALAPALDRLRSESGADLAGLSLVLSGMASSTIGLRELPYAPTPFGLARGTPPLARIDPGALPVEVVLVSGVCDADDVMRGEETLLIGLRALGFGDGLTILPGTHSKHVQVEGGTVVGFRTYLTGELFALLREHSTLRACLAADAPPGEAFVRGVRDAARSNLLHEAFALRARTILHAADPGDNAQRLSGLLIGHELRDLAGVVDPGRPILLAAAEPLRSGYAAALASLFPGANLAIVPAEAFGRAVARGQREILSRL